MPKPRTRPENSWFSSLRLFASADEQASGPRADLSLTHILSWADAYFVRRGQWPTCHAGPIPEAPGESWLGVEAALSLGRRGWPGDTTLAQLLAEHRGKRNSAALPPHSEAEILTWADAHRDRTGAWPTLSSGAVFDAPGEIWQTIDQSLRAGLRGLPGGSSLSRLLAAERGARHHLYLSTLTEKLILAWADAHRDRTGDWPTMASGAIPEAAGGRAWRRPSGR